MMEPTGQRERRSLGFTLVELLVSLAVVMALVTMATAIYSSYARDASVQVLKADLFTLRTAIQDFYRDFGRYPIHGRDVYGNQVSFLDNASSEIVQGVHNGSGSYAPDRRRYLPEIPIDPTTNFPDWNMLKKPYQIQVGASVIDTVVVTNVVSSNPAFQGL